MTLITAQDWLYLVLLLVGVGWCAGATARVAWHDRQFGIRALYGAGLLVLLFSSLAGLYEFVALGVRSWAMAAMTWAGGALLTTRRRRQAFARSRHQSRVSYWAAVAPGSVFVVLVIMAQNLYLTPPELKIYEVIPAYDVQNRFLRVRYEYRRWRDEGRGDALVQIYRIHRGNGSSYEPVEVTG